MFPSSKTMSKALAVVGGATLAASLGTGVGAAQPVDTGFDRYTPVEPSDYLVDDMNYYASVFFETPDGRMCGIYFNNGYAGCDGVPMDAPEGTNQVRTGYFEPGNYRQSDEPSFTVPGGQRLLPEGHKITRENTTCGVGYQGTVACEVNGHGFLIAATYGFTW